MPLDRFSLAKTREREIEREKPKVPTSICPNPLTIPAFMVRIFYSFRPPIRWLFFEPLQDILYPTPGQLVERKDNAKRNSYNDYSYLKASEI